MGVVNLDNTVTFYDMINRKPVDIGVGGVLKTLYYTNTGEVRHALRGRVDDGRVLTLYISEKEWHSLKLPGTPARSRGSFWRLAQQVLGRVLPGH